LGRVAAKARWGALFTAGLVRVYAGRAQEGQPDFPSPRAGAEPFQGFPAGRWHEVPERPGLERHILPVRAGDGRLLTLHHVRRAGEPRGARGPVVLAHGTGVRANLFYTPPLQTTIVDALLAAGHDVWLESWRGSIDLDTCEYTLDQVAAHDHPALVRAVLEETERPSLKAVVHCEGSTSFTMAAFAGLVRQVTHVVSNAVSLHVELTPASRRRLEVLILLLKPSMPGLDPQWAIRPPGVRTSAFARIALAGAENRCFLPSWQRRTHAWRTRGARASTLHVLPGYTQMDVWFGCDAARDVFPRILAALAE
jgi:hypothetical protein